MTTQTMISNTVFSQFAKRNIKSGILWTLSPLARIGIFRHGIGAGIILCYHRVLPDNKCRDNSPNDWLTVATSYFQQHMEVLASEFEPISIGELPSRINSDEKYARPFVCVTFDDGYLDNLTYALPIMELHRIPMTVYITSWQDGNIPGAWWHDLWNLLQHANTYSIELNGTRFTGSVTKWTEKVRAFRRLSNELRVGNRNVLSAFYGQLLDKLEEATRQECLFMNTEELKFLGNHPLVTVGSHTDGHFALSSLDDQEIGDQIMRPRAFLEALLGKPVSHFAYPYGLPWTFGSREFRLLANAGYDTAVTTSPGRISKETNTLALPRTIVGSHVDGPKLRTMLSGLTGLLGRTL